MKFLTYCVPDVLRRLPLVQQLGRLTLLSAGGGALQLRNLNGEINKILLLTAQLLKIKRNKIHIRF